MLRFEPHNRVVGERVRVIFRVSILGISEGGVKIEKEHQTNLNVG